MSTCNQHNTYSRKLFLDVLVPALNHTHKKSLIPEWFLQLFIYFLGCGCVKAVCGCYHTNMALCFLYMHLCFLAPLGDGVKERFLGWRSWRAPREGLHLSILINIRQLLHAVWLDRQSKQTAAKNEDHCPQNGFFCHPSRKIFEICISNL